MKPDGTKPFFLSDPRLDSRNIAVAGDTEKEELVSYFAWFSVVLRLGVYVPAGFIYDGESVPLWTRMIPFIGTPKSGYFRPSGCGHDFPYRAGGIYVMTDECIREVLASPYNAELKIGFDDAVNLFRGTRQPGEFVQLERVQADGMYLELARLNCAPERDAVRRHRALRLVGWRAWNKHRRNDANNQSISDWGKLVS